MPDLNGVEYRGTDAYRKNGEEWFPFKVRLAMRFAT
jgi:hypothetical protein